MDRLRMIEYFLASARHGSFSQAARSLGITPASISRQIHLLELRLGTKLFNRTTRRLSLTEGGTLFFETVSKHMDGLTDAEDQVSQLNKTPGGLLRVTAPASFGRLHIAPWLPRFIELYPDISLDLVFTDRLIDIMEEEIHIAIRITDAQDSNIISRKLARQYSIVCASPEYIRRHGPAKTFDELAGHNCLIFGKTRSALRWRLYKGGKEQGQVEVAGNLSARDGDTIHVATLHGLGVSVQPVWRIGDDLRSGRLVDLFPGCSASSIGAATSIHAFYLHREHLVPKVKALIDFLAETYGSPPYWE